MNDAPQHITVLLHEAVDALPFHADGIIVDCTFGRGGHSRLIAQRLAQAAQAAQVAHAGQAVQVAQGVRGDAGALSVAVTPGAQNESKARLIALDKDPDAVRAASEWGGSVEGVQFECVHAGFAGLDQVLDARGVGAVDGVLMDVGVSSPQIDVAARGFSFRRDGPLDMRMDTTQGITAAEWLESATEQQIREALKNYGEERHAFQIAQAIVARRAADPLRTTGQLAALVADVHRALRQRPEPGQDPATRTFQALRIHVNQELEELQAGVNQAMDRLRVHGRLAVISFHSLEDRIVKLAMRARAQPPQPPKRVPLRADQLPQAQFRIVGKATRPGADEVARNPRARSATLRVIERTAQSTAESTSNEPGASSGQRSAMRSARNSAQRAAERAAR